MAKRVLEVQITGDTKNLDRALGKSQKGLSNFAKNAAKTGAALGVAGLAGAAVESVKAFEEHRKVVAETDAVLKSTGDAAQVTAKHVADLASAIQMKTGIDDESIQSGENMLLTFKNVQNQAGKGNKIFDQATKIMVDMSAKFGTDAPKAAVQLGKALNDPVKGITALTRVGVTFSKGQKDQIKTLVESGHSLEAQKIILRELNSEFKGTAEAQATPLKKLKDRFGELAESIGGTLAPAVDRGASIATKFINQLMAGTGAGGRFRDTLSQIGSVISNTAASLAPMIGGIGKVALGMARSVLTFTQTRTGAIALSAVLGGLTGRLVALAAGWAVSKIGAFIAGIKEAVTAIKALSAASATTVLGALAVVIGTVAGAFMGMKHSTDVNKVSAQQLNDALRNQADALREVRDIDIDVAQRKANVKSANVGLAQATKRVTDLQRQGKTGTLEYKQALADQAQASVQAKRATRDLGDAEADSKRKRQDNSKAVRDSINTSQDRVKTLLSEEAAMAVNGASADDLRKKDAQLRAEYARLARLKTAKVRVDAVDNASAKIQKILAVMRTLKTISSVQQVLDITANLRGNAAKRKGGKVFQDGGLVPSILSPGELGVLPGGGAFTVPGQRVAADTVPMMLPSGTSIFTDSGQSMLAQGASMGTALAMQAPHFAGGGTVKGRVSWFGGPHDSSDSGRTAGGFTTATPGVAIRPGDHYTSGQPYLSYAGKPAKGYWDLHVGKHHAVLPQTDIGPNESTGRRIDFTYSALSRMGFTEGNFPTDATGTATWLGKNKSAIAGAGGTKSSSYTKFTPAPDTHPLLSSLLTPLTDTALGAGTDPPSRDTVLAAVLEGIVPDSALYGTRTKGTTAGIGATKKAGSVGKSGKRLGGVRDLASLVGNKFGLSVTSTTGGTHAKNSYHYKGLAVDMGGSTGAMNRAAAWVGSNYGSSLLEGIHNPNLSIKGGAKVSPSFWGATTWGQHANHIHLAMNGGHHYRGGGMVGFQNGGTATLRARQLQAAYNRSPAGRKKPHTLAWFIKQLAGKPGTKGADLLTRQLASRLKGRSQGALLKQQKAIAKRIAAKLKSGRKLTPTEQIQVKRLQGAKTLVENELGYPIDAALTASQGVGAGIDHEQSTLSDRLTIAGIDPDSAAGIAETRAEDVSALDKTTHAQTGVYAALTAARKTGNKDAIKQAEDELQSNNDRMLHLTAEIKNLDKTVSSEQQAQLDAVKAQTEAMKALTDQIKVQNDYANAVQSVTTASATKALADIISGQLGPRVAVQSQSAGSADVMARI